MSVRVPPVVLLLVLVASNCGRIGYDEIAGRGRPELRGGGATGRVTGPDAGSVAYSGSNSGSGGATGGRAAAGGTGFGGTTTSGGSLGTGAGVGIDASAGTGGTIGSGGVAGSGGRLDGGGGAVVDDAGIVGCADGQREGFLDLITYPTIAACAGGFALPGVVGLSGPACGRTAGDDGANPEGSGCNAMDLCAVGFHLCSSAAEVGLKSSTGCTGTAVGATPVFFIAAQSGAGQRSCGPTGADDVFGCGTLGARPVSGSNCAPLDMWSTNLCAALVAPWSCGADQTAEASNVVKPGPTAGGVLCCQDP